MNNVKTLGLVFGAGIVTISPATQAAQLTLNFDAFIPSARVDNPLSEVLPPFFTEFTGDDRGFDFEATQNGEARLFTEIILDTEAPDPLVSASTSGGITVGFLIQDGIEVSQSTQAIAQSSVEAFRTSETEILLKVAASTTNPLIEAFLPPDLPPGVEVPPAEYIYDIELTLLEDSVDYNLVGTTRAFPSYSAFLNQTPILLNPANGEDTALLSEIEPVSAAGTVTFAKPGAAVSEPRTGLAIGLVSAGLLLHRKRIGKSQKVAVK